MREPVIILLFVMASLLCAGCLDEERNPVIGTWEWSDGKGYVEQYTFHQNQSFQAEALGSTFSGTWEETSPGHYKVTYWNKDDSRKMDTLTDIMIFDDETDLLYFPGHMKVK